MNVFSRFLVKSPVFIRNFCKSKIQFNDIKKTFLKSKLQIGVYGCIGIITGQLVFHNSLYIGNCSSRHKNEDLDIYKDDLLSLKLSYTEIWLLCHPDLLLFLIAVFSACVAAIINIKIPLQLGTVVNTLTSLQTQYCYDFWDSVKWPSSMLLISYIIQAVSTTSYISFLSIIGERMAMRMRLKLFERIIIQDTTFFDKKRSGDLLNRITGDVQDFKSSFKQCVSHGLRSAIQIIGSTIALLYISPSLTGIVVFAIPGIVLIGALMGRFLRQRSREAQLQNSKAAAVATQAVANIGTVKSFAMEDIEIVRFNEENERSGELNSILGVGIGIFQGLSNLAINGIVFGVLFSGGYLMNNGALTPGDLMSFLVASQTIQRSLTVLSTLFGQIVRAKASGARITEYLKLDDPITSPLLSDLRERRLMPAKSSKLSKPSASVEFKNVSFHYPNRTDHKVLDGFSLFIPKGSIVALCGESGAGKSTIASLLQRFYDVNFGKLLIDNINVRDMKVSELRMDIVGVVSQQPSLFATTIRENIRYGRINASDQEIEDAAKQAQAHEFITTFKDGYNTMVGERGGEALSGGQRQRIAIARAILKNPRVLILDEATSALDTNSELLVQNALQSVMKDRTVIIIAHRLSTIKNADAIVVLNRGRIVEIGNHDQLMRNRGFYFDLVRKQEEKDRKQ